MIERTISSSQIQSMLQTLKQYQTQASASVDEVSSDKTSVAKSGFSDLVSGALQQVNQMQNQSIDMQQSFDRGEDIPLTDVVMSMQKSSLAFEATLQIRNKVLKAYEDILNMPV
jgi:flagellar hook-basal body complex protein FliE